MPEYEQVLSIDQLTMCMGIVGTPFPSPLPLERTQEAAEQRMFNAMLSMVRPGALEPEGNQYRMNPSLEALIVCIGSSEDAWVLVWKGSLAVGFVYRTEVMVGAIWPQSGRPGNCRLAAFPGGTSPELVHEYVIQAMRLREDWSVSPYVPGQVWNPKQLTLFYNGFYQEEDQNDTGGNGISRTEPAV